MVARCVSAMQAQGIDQWDDVYPNAEILREDVRSKTLFVAEREGVIVGAVCLNDAQPEQYRSVPWRCPDDHPLVVHRLCVHPGHQGQGIGRRLMGFAETYARDHGFRSIRLEVYPTASAAVALYARLGYALVGAVRFPRRRLAFDCMELVFQEKMEPDQPPRTTAGSRLEKENRSGLPGKT